jgi:hypothetical protein
MRTDLSSTSLAVNSNQHLPLPAALPASFTIVTLSSSEMLERMKAGLLKSVKPCVYNPASHSLQLLSL